MYTLIVLKVSPRSVNSMNEWIWSMRTASELYITEIVNLNSVTKDTITNPQCFIYRLNAFKIQQQWLHKKCSQNVKNVSAVWWCVYAYAAYAADVPSKIEYVIISEMAAVVTTARTVAATAATALPVPVKRIHSSVHSILQHTRRHNVHRKRCWKWESADFYAIPI